MPKDLYKIMYRTDDSSGFMQHARLFTRDEPGHVAREVIRRRDCRGRGEWAVGTGDGEVLGEAGASHTVANGEEECLRRHACASGLDDCREIVGGVSPEASLARLREASNAAIVDNANAKATMLKK